MFLGVDAGNSKTVALLCDRSGQVRGAARTGNGDIYGAATAEAAVEVVLTAVIGALRSAAVAVDAVTGAAFRLAGVDWPEDLAYWQKTIAARLPGLNRASILNDGFAPLRCGVLSGVGVAVVVGTGPAVAARGPGGREVSLGWWLQAALGATGLGDSALRAVYDADLGLGSPTALTAALLEAYQVGTPEQLLHAFTRREDRRPWLDRARSARAVLAAAHAGDAVAATIVASQAHQFAAYARVAAERAGLGSGRQPVDVVLSGSVLGARTSPMNIALQRALAVTLPDAVIVRPDLPPVTGAVLDALAESGAPLDHHVVTRLTETAPEPSFLLT